MGTTMSISIEEAKYYTQAYVSKVQTVEPGEANETGDAQASDTQATSIAPPPTSSPQLLSDSDMSPHDPPGRSGWY